MSCVACVGRHCIIESGTQLYLLYLQVPGYTLNRTAWLEQGHAAATRASLLLGRDSICVLGLIKPKCKQCLAHVHHFYGQLISSTVTGSESKVQMD